MSEAPNELRTDALLSVQRALLGMVTRDLRAVEVAIDNRNISGRFVYDGVLTEEHRAIVGEAETLVIGDMDDDVKVEFEAVSAPVPEQVAFVRGTTFCFLRREE